jgi:hypothetical protein
MTIETIANWRFMCKKQIQAFANRDITAMERCASIARHYLMKK